LSKLPSPSPEQISINIDRLLAGDIGTLKHIEIAQAVPEKISDLVIDKNNQGVDMLLGLVVAGLHEDDEILRQNTAVGLAGTLNCLVKHEEWQRMNRLLPAIEHVFRIAGDNGEAVEQSIAAVTKLISHHILAEQYGTARDALLIINGPATMTSATDQLREHAEQAANVLASPPVMDKLLNEYLHNDKIREETGRLLAAFGKPAAEFLMDLLSLSESKAERINLLKLIEGIGTPAENSLRLMLQQPAPWYVTRNIIKLLGKIGNSDCLEDVAQFLEHDDVRVRQEVLTAADKIGGHAGKMFLLKTLHTVPRQLTGQVVSLLGNISDDSLVVPLASLLDETSMYQSKLGDELQVTTCRALGKIGSIKALPTLKKIIANKNIPGVNEEELKKNSILQAATEAVQLIECGGNQKVQQTRVKKIMGVPVATDPVSAREAAIFRIALTGDKVEATRKLFELITDCVTKKDFQNAERLRQRIYEIDPMAITEIIRSTEVIEQAKNGVSGRGYLDVWSSLLDELSSEEFSSIYHELENKSLQAEELIVSQGDQTDELFFINQGSVKVFNKQNDHEIFIKNLISGEIAGENFFDASTWTVSMSALTPVRISTLKRSSFIRWQKAFPGLETKLKDFYNRSNDVHDLLDKKKLNRRKFERYQLSRKVQIQMTDGAGKPIGRGFNGELSDISKGGLALLICIAKQENGRLLLGKEMQITIPVGGEPSQLHVHGQVQAVHPSKQQHNEFQVHFTFHEELEQEALQTILG